ncbi:PREDICTED: inter-alpha-trypsin inhibitor heavy chain H3, partial [Myotis davidii]|uniref:inter-alpha-trypsin inhibitor heavy chain H3 n=1 Tax=Myotis davidii TaxID=225400 RepID=UPI000767AE2A
NGHPHCCRPQGPHCQPCCEESRLPVAPSPSFLSACLSLSQTKDALLKILEDKKEEDYLNFILFDSDVTTWKDTLVQATPENIQEAREFVKNIRDRGMTNINDGLLTGISMLNKAREEHTVPERSTSIVIMLTDGDANVGESRPAKIQENVLSAIGGRFPLYTLGFGNNLNYNFLESLALENDGFARRIYEDSDANLQLQVCLVLHPSRNEGLTPSSGSCAIRWSFHMAAPELNWPTWLQASIPCASHLVPSLPQALTDLTFTEEVDLKEMEKALQEQDYIFGSYIERLWAYLTIEQLLDKRKNAHGSEKENLTAQALDLSLKYHFVTPLTSMVVTKPEDSDNQMAIADKPGEGPEEAVTAATAYLSDPFSDVPSVDGDPHFIIQVRGKKDAICFNIDEEPGTVLRLIQDPITGLTVNGQIIGDKGNSSNSKNRKTYFGKVGIVNSPMDLRIEVTTEKITLKNGAAQSSFSWLDTVTVTSERAYQPSRLPCVSQHVSPFSRGYQRDYRKDVHNGTQVGCWFVHNNGQGVIDGVHSDYIVSDLF